MTAFERAFAGLKHKSRPDKLHNETVRIGINGEMVEITDRDFRRQVFVETLTLSLSDGNKIKAQKRRPQNDDDPVHIKIELVTGTKFIGIGVHDVTDPLDTLTINGTTHTLDGVHPTEIIVGR